MQMTSANQTNKNLPTGKVIVTLTAGLACLGFGSGCTSAGFGIQNQAQSFGQQVTINSQVDILVVTSSTSSMSTKNSQLASSFGSFIDYLSSSQFDFHIAVTTMDMSGTGQKGQFVGSPAVLSRSTANLKQNFINNMNVGTSGSDLPRGLEAMQAALSRTNITGVNSGFLRPSALLAVLFVSDQNDASSGASTNYETFLTSLKPQFPYGYQGWIANSFVVQALSSQCTTYNQYASIGVRFLDLSNASNGVADSICGADLVQATSDLQSRIASMLTQFSLGRAADPSTIQVFVNGVLVPQDPNNGWIYIASGFIIEFNGKSVPPANALVSVKFAPATI